MSGEEDARLADLQRERQLLEDQIAAQGGN